MCLTLKAECLKQSPRIRVLRVTFRKYSVYSSFRRVLYERFARLGRIALVPVSVVENIAYLKLIEIPLAEINIAYQLVIVL